MIIANFPAGSDTAAVAALREQVSNLLEELTENPEYAATAEVIDIRTASDGTVYPTAGDAVRAIGGDVVNLESVIALLQAALTDKVDGAYVEDGYLYMTSGDSIVVGPLGPFSGTGGGGTPSVGSVLKLTSKMASRSFSVMDTAEKVEISYNWTSYDSEDDSATGNGTASWYVGGVRVAMHTVAQGDNTFDVKSYLSVGTVNTVKLTIEDSYGATKSITWSVTVSSYGLTWNVAEMALHGSSALGLRLVPTGDGNKIIHVTVDGTEKCGETVATTGRTLAVSIDAQTHGAHVIEAWIETTVNGETLTTPHLRHVGIWVESGNTAPIVAFYKSTDSVAQYATVNNLWMAYSPVSEEVEVQRKIGNTLESTVTASRGVQTWACRAMTSGSITLKLVCGAVTAEKTLTVGSIGYDIAPVTSGLVLDLDPTGHSNTEAGRANFGYKDGSGTAHPLTFSENFDWDNGGFRADDDGVTAFVVRRGTYVEFDRSLFNDNAGTVGKEIKLVFKSMNVRNYDAELLRCKAGNVGLVLQAQQATLTSELTTIVSPYCEERKIEMDINVHATNDGAFATIWLGGKPARVMNYTSADSWQQSVPSALRIGSDDCDVWIYRIKMYSNALSRFEVLDNFIADTADPAEMIARYERNDIFSTSGAIDRVKLGQKNPNLRVIRIIAQKMTTAKTDNVTADIEHTMVNGSVEDNFSAKGITFKGQGTSSAEYGLAALNMDFDLSEASEWIDSNGDAMTEYAMTETSLPVAYFNFKANVASSENANNVCNADDYNNFNPTKVAARAADSRVRDTVEGHPAVVFFTNAADAAITVGSRTVQPGETILYASGDLNNSKKNFAENSPSIDVGAILENTSSIVRGRLTNVALNLATPDAVMRLVDCAGISAEGAIVENFVLTGTAYFTAITQAELDAIEAAFPDLTVTYGSIVSAHTVKFYVSDGTTSTLLYTEMVRHGGNAINPVTAGLIAEPTKPSTVQYNYRYTGWDTSLENVTTDLNIYAVFATSVRKYTVSFWSGTTLMQRTAVDCYGSVRYTGASPTAPEGTVWGGWDTLTINVQSDLDVRAVFISPTLPSSVPTEYDYLYSDDPADNSAFTFSEFWGIIKNGMAQDYFTVGDKIKICPNAEAFSDTSIVLQVETFNHYKMASGTKMADVFFGMVGIMNQKYQMNSSNVNADGWGASKMRTYLNDTIFPDLPQNWKAVISLVRVPSSKGSQSATIVTSNDKLFLRAYAECFSDGKTAVPYKDEIDADADAISISLYTDNTSRVKKMYNGTGTAELWWLRSPAADSAANFRYVFNSGGAYSYIASNSYGVSFGFCIGS